MLVETKDVVFESFFQHAQIEITGFCNMRCKHCRAADQENIHLKMSDINKILDFIEINRDDNFRLTISGGEPFLHPQLVEIVKTISRRNIEDIIITTNGSVVSEEHLQVLNNLKIKNLCLQVSLDSIYPEKHDEFRGFSGAYMKATKLLACLKRYDNISSSIRMTVTQNTKDEVCEMIDFAHDLGVNRVGIGVVIPVGAGQGGDLTLIGPDKRIFLENLARKRREYVGKLDVTTEDPLKFLVDAEAWGTGIDNIEEDDVFGGCTAGITGFNVNAEGTITPCAVLFVSILNIHDYDSVNEMLNDYQRSPVIVNLAERQFGGKCRNCKLRRICGGCRATAKGLTGDYLGEDCSCWRK